MTESTRAGKLHTSNVVFLVSDIAATIPWYEQALGFTARTSPASPPYSFGILSRDDVVIMLQQLEGYVKPDVYRQRDGGVWNVYIDTADVKALYDQVSQRSDVKIINRLRQQPYGQLEFEVADPNGYVLVFAEPTA